MENIRLWRSLESTDLVLTNTHHYEKFLVVYTVKF